MTVLQGCREEFGWEWVSRGEELGKDRYQVGNRRGLRSRGRGLHDDQISIDRLWELLLSGCVDIGCWWTGRRMAYTFGKKSSNVCCMFEEVCPPPSPRPSEAANHSFGRSSPVQGNRCSWPASIELCHPLDSIRGDGDEA